MEKQIGNKILKFGYIPVLIWSVGHLIYTQLGVDSSNAWWAFDKINDRVFQLLLIAYCFFVSYDARQRLFYIISGVYVTIVASFEMHYIVTGRNDYNQYAPILTLLLVCIAVITLITHHVRRN